MSQPLIDLQHISKSFDGEMVLDDLSLSIKENSFVTLLGPSGCGKSTTLRIIGGFTPPDKGNVIFDGQDITGMPPYKVAQLGIGRTFQNIRLFSNLSVMDNVIIASNLDATYNMPQAIFMTKKYKEREKFLKEKAMALLEDVGLQDKVNEKASSLPYGHQRKLEIARAMALDPKLLLLDEPVSGVDQNGLELFYEIVADLREKEDMAIILISHDLNMVAKHADQVVLMNKGVVMSGTPEEVFADRRTKKIFGMLAGESAQEAAADIPAGTQDTAGDTADEAKGADA